MSKSKLLYAYLTPQRPTHLNGGLHDDVGSIVDTLCAELQHGRVSLLFGLSDAVIDLVLTLREPRVHELAVEHRGPSSGRGQEPQHQQDLQLKGGGGIGIKLTTSSDVLNHFSHRVVPELRRNSTTITNN